MNIVVFFIVIWAICKCCKCLGVYAKTNRAIKRIEKEELETQRRRQQAALQYSEWRRQQDAAKAYTQYQIAQERERIKREQAAAKAREQAAKEAEKRRKADFECRQAQADLESLDAIREGYMRLYDALEAEMQRKDTTEKRRLAIQRQLLTLDERLYKLDSRRAKAYFVAVEGRAC